MNMCRFESLGVYLPEKTIANSESIDQVNVKGEDAQPLALKAAEECLSRSQYEAKDLDAIIFTSNTHFKNELTFTLEPSNQHSPCVKRLLVHYLKHAER